MYEVLLKFQTGYTLNGCITLRVIKIGIKETLLYIKKNPLNKDTLLALRQVPSSSYFYDELYFHIRFYVIYILHKSV